MKNKRVIYILSVPACIGTLLAILYLLSYHNTGCHKNNNESVLPHDSTVIYCSEADHLYVGAWKSIFEIIDGHTVSVKDRNDVLYLNADYTFITSGGILEEEIIGTWRINGEYIVLTATKTPDHWIKNEMLNIELKVVELTNSTLILEQDGNKVIMHHSGPSED